MKKLFIALSVLILALTAYGQETKVDEKTLANMSLSELEAYQKVLRVQRENQSKLVIPDANKLTQYAEVGKAFGVAFKECWSAVSKDAERFAQSSAGKWAMVLVSWKIMGEDAISITKYAVRWTVGLCLFGVGIPFWVFIFYRNCVSKRVLISKERTGLFAVKKTYDKNMSDPIHGGDGAPILYGVTFVIFAALTALMMFV